MKYRIVEHAHGPFELQMGNDNNEWRHLGVRDSYESAYERLKEIHDKGFTDFFLIHEVTF